MAGTSGGYDGVVSRLNDENRKGESESCDNMDSQSQESVCQQRSPGQLKLYPPVDLQQSARN